MTVSCVKHGLAKAYRRSENAFRCLPCSSEAVKRRRRRIKEQAVAYLGGRCQACGYSRNLAALQFHHKDPTQKDFHLAKGGHTRSWEKVRVELDKCVLLCANCHAEEHNRLYDVGD